MPDALSIAPLARGGGCALAIGGSFDPYRGAPYAVNFAFVDATSGALLEGGLLFNCPPADRDAAGDRAVSYDAMRC